MPNKTIYVADDDLPLFQRAQELAGSLSAAITRALRAYVDTEFAAAVGGRRVNVTVGEPGRHRRQCFVGTKICVWETTRATTRRDEGKQSDDEDADLQNELYIVYRTVRDQWAVHRRWALLGDIAAADSSQDQQDDWSDYTSAELLVYPNLDDLAAALPAELTKRVRRAVHTPELEVLDI
ncbi:MAG: EXLDI protein [Haloechinothrix sp.]